MPDLQTVLAPNPECPVRGVKDGFIVMSATGNDTHALDGISAFIWSQLDGRRDLAAVLAAILDAYEVEPQEARTDLLEFASSLLEAGLVERR